MRDYVKTYFKKNALAIKKISMQLMLNTIKLNIKYHQIYHKTKL